MYVRVVRFTEATADRVDATLAQINESNGPPPGISIARLQMFCDADQQTAVVVQHWRSAPGRHG